ncbi:hypothetical protein ACLMJK_006471 [Lecanora helva]
MTSPTVAIVTGANRGIGKAIAQTLAHSFKGPLVLYATSRKGLDMKFPTASETKVKYPILDIADSTSIRDFAQTIKKDHDAVDVLINNAGVNADDEYSPEHVRLTLDTNVRGTLLMCQTFIPLLRKTGRIVNVSSTASSLNNYDGEIRNRFRSSDMTFDGLEKLMQEYQKWIVFDLYEQQSANEGTESQHGWPPRAYSVSKACVNALTAVLARENQGLVINACCPGWVDTDMGTMVGSRPPKDQADGAKIPLRLGFGNIGNVTGRYWGNPSIADTGDGQVMEW